MLRFASGLVAVFVASAPAGAQTVSVVGTCPGPVDFEVTGATAFASVTLSKGESGGTRTFSGGGCTGTTIDLGDPDVAARAVTDGLGAATVRRDLHGAECGLAWQALDTAICTTSNVVSVPCGGADVDADGFTECTGDCDDANPLVNASAVDVCGDGIDANCSGQDASCAPAGQFVVTDGPFWGDDPRVVSCVEACARLFSGDPKNYDCSTSDVVVDFSAFLDGWGDSTFCFQPAAQDFSLQPANDGTQYNCGAFSCSFSAYVSDHGCTATNYCWLR